MADLEKIPLPIGRPPLSRRMKFITTFAVYLGNISFGCAFTAYGPALVDLKNKYETDTEAISVVFTVTTVSYLFGALASAFIYNFLHRQLGTVLVLGLMAVSMYFAPICPTIFLFFVTGALLGFSCGAYDATQIVWIMEIWQNEAMPFIQAQHFFYALGSVLPALVLAPFLTKEPEEVEGMTTTTMESTENPTKKLVVPFIIVGAFVTVAALTQLLLFIFARYHAPPPEEGRLEAVFEQRQEVTYNNNKENIAISTPVRDWYKIKLIVLAATFLGASQGMEICSNQCQFESNGRLVPGTRCDYQFLSANYTSAEGRFFSPNYPSTYPHNVQCSYFFHAGLHERVKIIFEAVSLQPAEYSCLNKTDVIRVVDGSIAKAPVISLICNAVKEYEVLSTGSDLLVEFISNSDNPSNGFTGKFYFVKVQLDNPYDFLRLNQHLQSYEFLNFGQDGLTQASTLVPQCNQVVTSDAGRNGTFTSPNYPHQYPPKTRCRFEFLGHGKERVQIVFTDFSLYHPDSEPKSCEGEDALLAFVHFEGNLARVAEFCGINTPLSLMSNGHRLTLEMNAPQSSRSSRGFSALYYFIEDSGIKTGRQLRDYPCAFVYNSTETVNGTFTSPNYPGLYPRNTECHYFFHGDDNQHVDLHFTHFSVFGSGPCDESTKSDYVEFSNYMPVDKSYKRTCGNLKEFRLQSLGKFFRVSFRSNSLFDSTGFSAAFSFCDKPGHKQKRNSISGSVAPLRQGNPTGVSTFVLLGIILGSIQIQYGTSLFHYCKCT